MFRSSKQISPRSFLARGRLSAATLVALFFLLAWSERRPIWADPNAAAGADPNSGLYESFEPKGDIRRFDGETLYYDISFLWFDKAATATVAFYKLNGQYQALLVAETKGVVGWFTSYRRHIYRATFEILNNGERVRSNKFEREVIIGDTVEKTVHTLDYTIRKHQWTGFKNGAVSDQGTEEILPPDASFDDILAAFYNFRNSAYGPLTKGAFFKIHTIPEKGVNQISIRIKNEKEEEEIRNQQGRKKGDELLLNVTVPKEIFKTKTGELLFWSSKHYVPLETTVVEYILLGDLHARFVKRTILKSPLVGPLILSEKP